MKILVSIKRVIDYNSKIRIKPDHSGIDTQNAKMSLNPFDAIALEAAVRLKEQGHAESITAISLGDASTQDTLREALALGADEAIWGDITECSALFPPPALPHFLQPLSVAKILHHIIRQDLATPPDLIIMGKQAIDDDSNQTPQMLAGMLNWPQAMFVCAISRLDAKTLIVARETDQGLQNLSVTLPAVLSADLRLNQPRYASLPNIMQAKRKPLRKVTISPAWLENISRLTILKITEPKARMAGHIISSAAELAEKIKEK